MKSFSMIQVWNFRQSITLVMLFFQFLKNLALNIQNCIRSNLFFGQCLKGRLRKEGPILSIKKDIVGVGEHADGERVKNFVR